MQSNGQEKNMCEGKSREVLRRTLLVNQVWLFEKEPTVRVRVRVTVIGIAIGIAIVIAIAM